MNGAPRFFNYFFRYRWGHQNFEDLQQSILDTMRGPWEGETGAGILDGLELSATALNVGITPGIAVGPSGYLLAVTGTTVVGLTAPVGNPCRSLIVARPNIIEDTPIVRPTSPFDTVYLNELLGAEIVVLNGTAAASPVYPTPEAGDVVLAAYRLAAGATGVTSADLDSDMRDDFGRNGGDLALLLRGDPRLRPELATLPTMTVAPSQTIKGTTKLFTYPGSAKPAVFPLTGGVFTEQDAILNFLTGAITGGDGTSPDFTPTIPTAGNFIWALVTLTSANELAVGYGTQGTYAQCKAALVNQTSVGAGAIPTSSSFKIAFVLIGSANGSTVSEMELVDARGPNNFVTGEVKAITVVTSANSPYVMTGTEQVIQMDATGGAVSVTLPARAANQGRQYDFDRIDGSGNSCTVNRAGSDTFAEPVNTTSYPFEGYESHGIFAGSTLWKVRG